MSPSKENSFTKERQTFQHINTVTTAHNGDKIRDIHSPEAAQPADAEEPELTWQEIAKLFDRLFLMIFLFLMFLLAVVVVGLLYEDYNFGDIQVKNP